MKKLKQNSIDIRPMTEKPDVNFRYIFFSGKISPAEFPLAFNDTVHAFGWIPAQLEVIDELTFEELEIGEYFAADIQDGQRYIFSKMDQYAAYSFNGKHGAMKYGNEVNYPAPKGEACGATRRGN